MQPIVEPRPMVTGIHATAAAYVRAAATHIDDTLIDRDCLTEIEEVVQCVPAAVTAHSMFECRLGVEDALSDYSIATSIVDGGRAILGGTHPSIPLPGVLAEDARWEPLARLVRDWGDADSPLFPSVDHFWLEFDVAGPGTSRDVPSLFFAVREGGMVGGHGRAVDDEVTRARAIVRRGMELLAGGLLPAATDDALETCFREMPAHAFLFQVGVMTARRSPSVRLLLSGLTPGEFTDYLGRIGSEGDLCRLRHTIDELSPCVDGMTYGIELDGGIGRRVGLECYVRNDDPVHAHDGWTALLDLLVDRGLCLPIKRDGLLRYPGIGYEDDGCDGWPAHLSAATPFFGGGQVPVLMRCIHHVKLAFIGDRAVEAKAYPGLSLRWIRRGGCDR